MKKIVKNVFLLGLAASMGAGLIAVNNHFVSMQTKANEGEYTLTLDSSKAPAGLTDAYQDNLDDTITHQTVSLKFSFEQAKASAGAYVNLANHGKIYNNFTASDAYKSRISSITSITATFSGALTLQTSSRADGKMLGAKTTMTSGQAVTTNNLPYYFCLEAGDNDSGTNYSTTITSIVIKYTCEAFVNTLSDLAGTFTGVGNDGVTYKLVALENGNTTISSLDLPSNIQLNGTTEMLDGDTAKCTFTYNTAEIYYVMDLSADGSELTFVSKSDNAGGQAAAAIPEIHFYRVYTVENFESYSASGKGWTGDTEKRQTTGLRSQYYADYYTGSGSGQMGGSGWPVMTSTDNTTLLNTKGHNSKGVAFKFSSGTSMRYTSMKELYGTPTIMGKGTTLSFWARGAYTNANFNTNHSSNIPFKVYAYFDKQVTPSNQQTVRTVGEYTVNAGNEWQRFTLALDSTKTYYGFSIYAQQSSGSTAYVPFDDFEIYTVNPYAEYVAPVAATGVSVSPTVLDLVTGHSGNLTATVTPADATNKNVTWSSNNTSVATVDNGTVTAVAAGNATITVTTQDGGYTASCAVTVTDPAPTAFPEGTYRGSATVMGNSFAIVISIGNTTNNLVAVRLANTDAAATGISYNPGLNGVVEFTITTTGSYQGQTFGNISGTYNPANDNLTGVKCNGAVKNYVSNNGSITCTKATTSSTSFFADCDGTTAELQSQFKRRYGDPWTVDTINSNRLESETSNYVSGSGAMAVRPYNGNRWGISLQNDFSPTITVSNVHFWVYNPSGTDVTLRMWGYRAANLGSNFETGSVTAKANGWSYVAMGFTSGIIYNFQIAHFNGNGAKLVFDNIYLF